MPATQGSGWTAQTYTVTAAVAGGGGDTEPITLVVSNAPVCALSNLTVSPGTAPVKQTGQEDIQAKVIIRVDRSSLTACGVPTVSVTPGNSGPGTGLTTPKTMHNVGSAAACTALTCEWVIPDKDDNWLPAPSTRTVTVTASGQTLTATLSLT
jgi:hypothetical protein